MIDSVAYVVITASLLLAAWMLIEMILGRIPRELHVIGTGAVELLLALQLVVSFVVMIVDGAPDALALFLSYQLFTLLILPAALFWALAEKSRWGTGVLVVAALVVPALVVRLQQIWDGIGV